MPKFKDYTGHRFGRLMVVKLNEELSGKGKGSFWDCKCDCGNEKTLNVAKLISGNTQSCGCLHKEQLTERNIKHGMTGSKLYTLWRAMHQRCYYEKNDSYYLYGAKGIKVCDEWKNSYQAFYDWSMANGYKDGLSIDRIDSNDDYKPSNCRWTTMKEQANHTSRNHFIEYNGECLTLSQASEKYKIPYHTLKARINKLNWPVEVAITTPVSFSNNSVMNKKKGCI